VRPSAVAATSLGEVAIVVSLCFGWFIAGSIGAVMSGFPASAFDDSTFLNLVPSEFVFGAAALLFLHYRGHAVRALVPRPTALGSLVGLALYAATIAAIWPIQLAVGAQQVSAEPIEQMVRWATISLPALIGVSIVNGIYEETFLTGYLIPSLQSFGAPFAIGVSVLVRVLYHLYQGPLGAISILLTGTIFGIYYWKTRKLWPVAFAHIFADFAGFALS